jgi:ComF family protein
MKSVRHAVNFFTTNKVDEHSKTPTQVDPQSARWYHRLWPSRCIACGDQGEYWQQQALDLCAPCLRQLPWLENACRHCAEPICEHSVCGRCLKDPPAIQGCWVPLRYEAPVSHWLTHYKYRAQFKYGRLLSQLLARTLIEDQAALPQLIIPVPLHRQKLAQRGFNQALMIAKDLGRQLKVPVSSQHLIRTRQATAQAGLDLKSRQRNLRQAFATQGRLPQHVALVDDVITTASTIRTCARQLQRAGVKQVDVWALARTP